jgi:hypothetical protein
VAMQQSITRGRDGGDVVHLREVRTLESAEVKQALARRAEALGAALDEAVGDVLPSSSGKTPKDNGSNGRQS